MSEIVGFSGSPTQPSRTRALVIAAVQEAARQSGLGHHVFDLNDLGASFRQADTLQDLPPVSRAHVDRLLSAQAIVIGSPVYKGSYTGLFKHLFDLIEPEALRDKPVLLTATGGGHRHALVIEHQLRPLLGFFEARVVPTGVYAGSGDIADGAVVAPDTRARLEAAVGQLVRALRVDAEVSRPVTTAA